MSTPEQATQFIVLRLQKILEDYNPELLNQMNTVMTAVALQDANAHFLLTNWLGDLEDFLRTRCRIVGPKELTQYEKAQAQKQMKFEELRSAYAEKLKTLESQSMTSEGEEWTRLNEAIRDLKEECNRELIAHHKRPWRDFITSK